MTSTLAITSEAALFEHYLIGRAEAGSRTLRERMKFSILEIYDIVAIAATYPDVAAIAERVHWHNDTVLSRYVRDSFIYSSDRKAAEVYGCEEDYWGAILTAIYNVYYNFFEDIEGFIEEILFDEDRPFCKDGEFFVDGRYTRDPQSQIWRW